MLKTPRRRDAALCALGAAAGAQGHGLPVPGPRRVHREIFRDRARPARARLRGRDARLARAGRLGAAAAQSAQGLCAPISPTTTSTSRPSCNEVVLPDCPPPVFALAHSMGATVLIRAAHQGHRWFDRMVLLAPMIGLPGMRRSLATRIAVRDDAHDRARRRLCAGRRRIGDAAAPVHRQPADLRSGALCAQRRGAGGGAGAGDRLADGGVGGRRVPGDGRAFRARLSGQDPPADAGHRRRPGPDRVDAGDRRFRRPAARGLASHRAGRAPRAADGAGPLRGQVLAAFDAFVPGTPLF